MHTRKELEMHQVEKRRLSCDSGAPQVRSAWSHWTRVVKVDHHKMRSYPVYMHIYFFNNKGPKTDPWGTPCFNVPQSEKKCLVVLGVFLQLSIFYSYIGPQPLFR
jgi:hypothetical protein